MNDKRAAPLDLKEEARRVEQLIGAELHDTVCQTLVGTGLLVKVLLRQAEAGQTVGVSDLKKLSALIEGTMADLRLILPVDFTPTGKGLAASLQNLANFVSRTTTCSLHLDADILIVDTEVAETLYGLARQAMRYALKGNTGTAFNISLLKKRGLLKLEIRLPKGLGKTKLKPEELDCLRRFAGEIPVKSRGALLMGCAVRVADD